MHMVAHRWRDTNSTRRTLRLKPRSNIHRAAVQISPISNRVANVDPDTKADGLIGGLLAIVDRNLLLHLRGAAHRSVNAVEHDQEGVTLSLDDPTTMLVNRWVDDRAAQVTQPFAIDPNRRRCPLLDDL